MFEKKFFGRRRVALLAEGSMLLQPDLEKPTNDLSLKSDWWISCLALG